jgi:DNA-binding response OmpR family regulator
VRIDSAVGAGATITLYLPRDHADPAPGEESAAQDLPPAAGAGEVVLVIEDEPTIRMLVAEVLEEFGYACIEASDGTLGLSILQSGARIDLLITDVGLPGGLNGRQIADAARTLRPELKVLFITGYAQNAAVGGEDLDPGMQVMTKPFGMDALAARIRAMIEA